MVGLVGNQLLERLVRLVGGVWLVGSLGLVWS